MLHDFVFDGFFFAIQVARTSRRENHSRIRPGLEDTEGSHPERNKEGEPPRPRGANQNHCQRACRADRQHCDSHQKPVPPLSWTDVDGSAARHLEQVPKLFDGYPGFAKNPMEDFRLERTAGMEGHDNFLSWVLTVPECNVAPDLMIPIPSCPAKGSN